MRFSGSLTSSSRYESGRKGRSHDKRTVAGGFGQHQRIGVRTPLGKRRLHGVAKRASVEQGGEGGKKTCERDKYRATEMRHRVAPNHTHSPLAASLATRVTSPYSTAFASKWKIASCFPFKSLYSRNCNVPSTATGRVEKFVVLPGTMSTMMQS